MKKKNTIFCLLGMVCLSLSAQQINWPQVKTEMKPAARWWWMGSAVDKDNLVYNMGEYARKGMGGLEITPIYGIQNNEANEIQYLSPRWMEMLQFTEQQGNQLGLKIDMNGGTGWPFGGPYVSIEDAATKVIFEEYNLKEGQQLTEKIEPKDEKQKSVATFYRLMAFSDKGEKLDLTSKVKNNILSWTAPKGNWRLIAVFNGKTLQQVKRAAPGGEGLVMNHFSKTAVSNYLTRLSNAFKDNNVDYPNSFFNDSYEVYGADWTPDLFEQFEKRRGYKLENYLPEFISEQRTDITARIIADYRETLADLLLENFTHQWTDWAHQHESKTRNQAHGSPGNLIDLYATVDIPECESFGISDFHIDGLRKDTIKKVNDSDLSMLKYASSGAHITGKLYTSAETLTWLTEHFRTSLSQCKPDLDLLFLSGVNHVFFHGTTYSPKEAKWPGWKFYASIDMSPTNSIWRDAGALFDYITRCQSFLQEGKPDNDFLLYFPVYDMWHQEDGRLLMFDIHKMQERAPQFISAVNNIVGSGYDVDYISDNYLLSTKVINGKLVTSGNTSYKAIIVPAVKKMPIETLSYLLKLAKNGAKVVFIGNYPNDVPGFKDLDKRKAELVKLINQISGLESFAQVNTLQIGKGQIITGSDYAQTLDACKVRKEEMKTLHGLQYIRRSNNDGYHYFISALKSGNTEGWITLGVDAENVMLFNPMDGKSGLAKTRREGNKTQVYLQLESGQSIILKTFDKKITNVADWDYYSPHNLSIMLNRGWTMKFIESSPQINTQFKLNKLGSWTDIDNPDLKINMGTALYSTEINLPLMPHDEWELDLGDVRESARVRINGQDVATLWAVPFKIRVGKYLKEGNNRIEVEVTNLPANRIAEYDRQKIDWRIFKEINFVKIDYKKGNYGGWDIMPSGLLGPVTLTPLMNVR